MQPYFSPCDVGPAGVHQGVAHRVCGGFVSAGQPAAGVQYRVQGRLEWTQTSGVLSGAVYQIR